jgi:hypothetical protein
MTSRPSSCSQPAILRRFSKQTLTASELLAGRGAEANGPSSFPEKEARMAETTLGMSFIAKYWLTYLLVILVAALLIRN